MYNYELQSQKQLEDALPYWVWLSLIFGAANAQLHAYLGRYQTPQALCSALEAGRIPDLPMPYVRNLKKYSFAQAINLVEYCAKQNIALISMNDPRYPQIFRQIYIPPVLFTAQGNLNLLRVSPGLTVVGARHPSNYSIEVTKALLTELSQCGFVVISGFAEGIDGTAHTAALDAGLPTIAVLGCGVNVNYPRANAQLRSRMLSDGKGLLLSEYLPGVQPAPAHFPKRNRLLSALGDATLIVEASIRSGSLVTAEHALQQGKLLFCVPPHDLFDPRYAGVFSLLRDGAIPLFSHLDLLYEFYTMHPRKIVQWEEILHRRRTKLFADASIPTQPKKAATQKPANNTEAAILQQQPVPPAMTADEATDATLPETDEMRTIVQFLRKHGEAHINELAASLDMDLSTLLSCLTMLEMDGFVESLFGSIYRALPLDKA